MPRCIEKKGYNLKDLRLWDSKNRTTCTHHRHDLKSRGRFPALNRSPMKLHFILMLLEFHLREQGFVNP